MYTCTIKSFEATNNADTVICLIINLYCTTDHPSNSSTLINTGSVLKITQVLSFDLNPQSKQLAKSKLKTLVFLRYSALPW